jgi:STE24 endopeptidase
VHGGRVDAIIPHGPLRCEERRRSLGVVVTWRPREPIAVPTGRRGRSWWVLAWTLATIGALAVVTHPARTPSVGASAERSAAVAPGIGHLDVFEPDVLAEVAAYRAPRRAVALVLLASSVVVPLAVLVRLGAGRDRDGRRRRSRWLTTMLDDGSALTPALRLGLLAGAVSALVAVVRLPAIAWLRLVHDARFGMRTQSALSWLGDHLLAVGTRVFIIALAAAGVSWLVRRAPDDWPARLTVVASLVVLAAVSLHPVVVHPLLLPERELPVGPHREAVLAVVARSGLDVEVTLGAASLRTPRRNAVATGLGPTRRIVLHDTLFDLEPAAVAAITAHEVAHLEHRDLARGALAVAPVVLIASLGAARVLRRAARHPSAPASAGDRPSTRALLGVVCIVLIAEVLASPILAAHSRRIESAADARAVVLAGAVEPWIVTLRAFTLDDLADPEPPRWSVLLASHPSSAQRIRAALLQADRAGIPVDVGQVLSVEASRPARR